MSRSREEIARWAEALEGRSPAEILASVAEAFPGRVGFATGFGAEGCVLVDVAARANVALDVFTIDTGHLFPETYVLWKRLEERYGRRIRRVAGADEGLPPALWQSDPDRCCEVRKVLPLRAELGRFGAWVTAIRRDQTPDRADAAVVEWDERFGLVKVNPLAAWTSRDVWQHVRTFDVPTNPLHDQGYTSIGCAPCTTAVLAGEDPRAGRWRGRAKTECGLHARPKATSTSTSTPTPTATPTSTPTSVRRPPGGFILWLTGLSGAGKSTLAAAVRSALGESPVEILDGDELRTFLSPGLAFTKADRDANVRRIGFVARLLARNGVAVVAAAISPYAAARDEVRALAERDGVPFVEVHVAASIERLAERDVKGLYRKALAGELPNFTGVTDPYEPPLRPEVLVQTDAEQVERSAEKILAHLRARGLVRAAAGEASAA